MEAIILYEIKNGSLRLIEKRREKMLEKISGWGERDLCNSLVSTLICVFCFHRKTSEKRECVLRAKKRCV